MKYLKKFVKAVVVTITAMAATVNCFAGLCFALDFAETKFSPNVEAKEFVQLYDTCSANTEYVDNTNWS